MQRKQFIEFPPELALLTRGFLLFCRAAGKPEERLQVCQCDYRNRDDT